MRVEESILVVDDDPGIREFVRQVLEDEGYRALAASDGVMALSLLARPEERPFDLILLDMRLPGMSSRHFAASYRQMHGPHAPIVLFSAAEDAETAAHATEIQAAGILAKPFDLDTLDAVIVQCLERRPCPAVDIDGRQLHARVIDARAIHAPIAELLPSA